MESQETSRAGQTMLARLMESQIWHLPASSVTLWEEDSLKGQWPLPAFLSGRKLSPALTLMPDTSVPHHMTLVSFRLLHQSWNSGGVSLSKSVCEFFKRNCLGLQKILPPTQTPLLFAARSYGNCLSFWHWNPGLGGLVWG